MLLGARVSSGNGTEGRGEHVALPWRYRLGAAEPLFSVCDGEGPVREGPRTNVRVRLTLYSRRCDLVGYDRRRWANMKSARAQELARPGLWRGYAVARAPTMIQP
jgi:hypothetical protein